MAGAFVFAGFVALRLAGNWPSVLATLFIVGMGFGTIIQRLNYLFAGGFGDRSLSMMQFLNAAYNVGTILGPLIIGSFHPPIRALYTVIATAALVLLPMGILAERNAAGTRRPITPRPADTQQGPIRIRLLIGFTAMMIMIIGVEHSIAGWLATLSRALGLSGSIAANLTALFFALIFSGRLLAAITRGRFDAVFTVFSSIVGVAGCVAISLVPGATPYALALAGFAIAPYFSATLVWRGRALSHSTAANSIALCGAILGSAVFAPLVGRVIEHFGSAAAPLAILMIASGGFIVCLWLRRRCR